MSAGPEAEELIGMSVKMMKRLGAPVEDRGHRSKFYYVPALRRWAEDLHNAQEAGTRN